MLTQRKEKIKKYKNYGGVYIDLAKPLEIRLYRVDRV